MFWNDFDLPSRVAWYTRDHRNTPYCNVLQDERERLLAAAREAEALAATLQALADDLRRIAA